MKSIGHKVRGGRGFKFSIEYFVTPILSRKHLATPSQTGKNHNPTPLPSTANNFVTHPRRSGEIFVTPQIRNDVFLEIKPLTMQRDAIKRMV